MGHYAPPKSPPLTPVIGPVPAGTVLFRIHSRQFSVDSFNPNLSNRYFGGGRFDATNDDKYRYMYLGSTVSVTLAETLLRDLPLNENFVRRLQRDAYKDRRLSAVQLSKEVEILHLRSSEELGSVAQDTWLTQAPANEYAQTRHWCHWLREQIPSACGLSWASRRDPAGTAYVLFGDRISAGTVTPLDHPEAPVDVTTDFSTREGRVRLRSLAAKHGVAMTL